MTKDSITKIVVIVISGIIVIISISVFYFYFQSTNSIDKDKRNDMKTFGEFQKSEIYIQTQSNLQKGDFDLALASIEEYIKANPDNINNELDQSVELYRISIIRQKDRLKSYEEYYNFFRNENNSKSNRAYAAIAASQQATANREYKKLLIFLSGDEVRNLKEITHSEVTYSLNKKIFALYSFPIVAVRLANYEIRRESDVTKKKEIYDKYMFNFYQNIDLLNKEPGLGHLNSGALMALGMAQLHLEDYGIVNSSTTLKTLQDSLNLSIALSQKVSQEYSLLLLLEYAIKHKKTDMEKQVLRSLSEFPEITPSVKEYILDDKVFKVNYPILLNKIETDSNFKKDFYSVLKI